MSQACGGVADNGLFSAIQQYDHEAVLFVSDKETGLRGYIGIHDTTLGPALGGCRMRAYANEHEAFTDVLALSRAMTFKAAAADLNLGGGKTVLIMDTPQHKTPERLHAFAERLNLLQGRYYGAGDVGSTTEDLRIIREKSPFVAGLSEKDGGLGDSAQLTSLGVFLGLKAAVKDHLKRDMLDGVTVAVQGTGKVGYFLMQRLLAEGAIITATDTVESALNHVRETLPQVTLVSPEALNDADVDVFSPNAVGGLLTATVAKNLKAKIVAGGANNPLTNEGVDQILHERGILYAPDFLINSGGITVIASEIQGLTVQQAEQRVMAVYERTLNCFEMARSQNLLPWDAARKMAMDRMATRRAEIQEQQAAGQTPTVYPIVP